MKVGILTFEQMRGQRNHGSSRIRGKWIYNNWDEAERFVMGKHYDAVIYQKAYHVDHAKAFKGKKIFDICDADFLHWGYRTVEMINEVDAITTSSEELAKTFRNFTDKPVFFIPDRIDLSEIKEQKYHKGEGRTVAWYGYSSNFEMLKQAVPSVVKEHYDLMVLSDGSFNQGVGYKGLEVRNVPFSWETFYSDILDADVIINPQSKEGKWKYKSSNKTLLAWALGLPVAETPEDLKRFKSETERRKESTERLNEVKEKWDVRFSVEEYKKILAEL